VRNLPPLRPLARRSATGHGRNQEPRNRHNVDPALLAEGHTKSWIRASTLARTNTLWPRRLRDDKTVAPTVAPASTTTNLRTVKLDVESKPATDSHDHHARQCADCEELGLCVAAANKQDQQGGVWAGRDRSRPGWCSRSREMGGGVTTIVRIRTTRQSALFSHTLFPGVH
jgi:hypothetical protein